MGPARGAAPHSMLRVRGPGDLGVNSENRGRTARHFRQMFFPRVKLTVPEVLALAPSEELFRHKILRLLKNQGLLDDDRIQLLLSWRHSGFSIHNSVTVLPGDGRASEALARYCMRNPVSLSRLCFSPGEKTVTYLPKTGHDDEDGETFDAMDFLARVLAHVPDPRRHLVHYYGAYSNVARGKRKAQERAKAQEEKAPESESGLNEAVPAPSPTLAALRRSWARLLKRIYEIDPLICPRCEAVMRVISFITEPKVIRRILEHLSRRSEKDRSPPTSALPDST